MKTEYTLNPNHSAYADLLKLCKTVKKYHLDEKLSLIQLPDSVVIWRFKDEYLVKVNTLEKYINELETNEVSYRYTSVTALGHYGIEIFKIYDVVYVAFEKNIVLERTDDSYASAEDVIIHLLIDGDERHFEFACVLAKKYKDDIDRRYLIGMANKYEINRTLQRLFEYTKE